MSNALQFRHAILQSPRRLRLCHVSPVAGRPLRHAGDVIPATAGSDVHHWLRSRFVYNDVTDVTNDVTCAHDFCLSQLYVS